MRKNNLVTSVLLLSSILVLASCATEQKKNGMSFFVTSTGLGKGGDLGGLVGADSHCQRLAESVGVGNRTWHAYLSTQTTGGVPAVNARDRIGAGPWNNSRGMEIARSVDELHGTNKINQSTALDERCHVINGRGDTPNLHDILTGSDKDGKAIPNTIDATCGNWTQGGITGAAMVGHHDRMGVDNTPESKSWNSSHLTRGCTQSALETTGGVGLLYCFAAD